MMEAAERLAAKPLFLMAFNVTLVIAWLTYGVDVANIIISIVTAELVLVGLGANRRSQLGIHAKLDELIHATQTARDELERVEELSEAEIETRRLGTSDLSND